MKKILSVEDNAELLVELAALISKPSVKFFGRKFIETIINNRNKLDDNLCINLNIIAISLLTSSLLESLTKITDAPREILIKNFNDHLIAILEFVHENH